MATIDEVRDLAASEQGLCVVSTVRADGSVHSSVVNAGPIAHPVSGQETMALVARGSAHKVSLMHEAGRASLTFRRGWKWAGVEGKTSIIGPDDVPTGVDLASLLQDIFRAAGGTHDDWDEFDRVMADEGRVAIFVTVDRVLGNS